MRRYVCSFLLCFLAGTSAFAQTSVSISGTLLGADGEPMQRAHVVVEKGPSDTTVVAEADEEGRFAFTLAEPGGYGMYLMGVHHETLEVPLIVTEAGPVELDVHLVALRYNEAPDTVRVLVPSTDEEGGTLMERQADGTFTAEIETTSDTLAYQIAGIKLGRGDRTYPMAGVQADRFAFHREGPFWDDDSDYLAVIDAQGSPVEVTFDPAALLRGEAEPVIESNPAVFAEIARVYQDVEERERLIGEKNMATRPMYDSASEEEKKALSDSLRDVMNAFMREVQEPIRQRIEAEKDPLVRQWLVLRYFDELHPPEDDSLLARQALEEVPPTSPFWSFEAWSQVGASNLIFSIARVAKDSVLADMYMDRVIEAHPDPDVRAQFLYGAVAMADQAGNEERKQRYYAQIQEEHGDTRQAEQLRRQFSKERAIQAGEPVPSFAFAALEDSSVTHTDTALREKTYLIDFWGTWCGPCIEEMPNLHEAYEKYREDGFEILSVAMMDERAAIEAFREEKHPMPWLHTLVPSSAEKDVRTKFEITGFPRPILVDASGTIIATDDALRGEKLAEVLARRFEE